MDLVARLNHLMLKKGINGSSLAKRSGVSQAMVSGILRGEKNPTVCTMGMLCDALDVSLEQFFSDPPPDIRPSIASLMNVANSLPDDKVDALVAAAKAMR